MAKIKTQFVCSECGYETPRWFGKCPSCESWNTLEETQVVKASSTAFSKQMSSSYTLSNNESGKKLSEINDGDEIRYNTGLTELNRVLGGGVVKGSVVLLGGDPGIGKSTLMLQICEFLGKENLKIFYISGEESIRQISLRASRLAVKTENLTLYTITDAEKVVATVLNGKPDIVIIDSIQTMTIDNLSSSAGSIVQVRECTNIFMKCAKSEAIPFFIVGHVNKDGAIAGPKVLEHIVDCVLHFEGERHLSYRILRAVKNRYGSTNEIGVFEMDNKGLTEVTNPSKMMLEGKPEGASGTGVACVMEGSRPILTEIQALATKSSFAAPRRMSAGVDYNRLALLVAVMEKRGGYFLGNMDIFINVVGGLRIDDPAVCLPVMLSLFSALRDFEINPKTASFGEIGLAGEIRSVSNVIQRIKE
ncbi:MAG: DNA repair protein RadA, partial [Oscillospiraceae bacterium]